MLCHRAKAFTSFCLLPICCVGVDVDPSCLQVVKELSRYTKQFRVLALTATPGSDTKVREPEPNGLCLAAPVGY